MIKNMLSVLVLIFIIFFSLIIGKIYFSEQQKKKININRETISKKIKENINNLPLLINDTNNVIEFNSGFTNKNNKKERNFWKLFKIND